ncbi:MAG: MFS transporter [Phycisphaeraceae bacterium]|nr:MFS transporter [Phycisphaeraceae bacterium]
MPIQVPPAGGGKSSSTLTGSGFRRAQWVILIVSMFCYLFYYTGRQTFGFAIPGIQQELGLSKTTLGWISASMLWAYALGQAVNGNLGDKFGGRRMVSLGALLSCLLNWVVSFGRGTFSLMIPWAMNGYVQAMGWAPGSRVVSNWWSHHERGRAYGLYVFAAGSASVVAFCTSMLIVSLHLDWRWIFRLPVLLMLMGGLVYYLLVRDKPEDRGFASLADAGAEDDDEQANDQIEAGVVCAQCGYSVRPNSQHEKCPECHSDLSADGAMISAGDYRESSWRRYKGVLSNWRFMIASLAIGFQSIARYGLLIWVPVYFLGENWKQDPTGAWVSVALPVGMALGALSSGWMSDRIFGANRSKPIALFLFLAAVSSILMFNLPRGHMAGVPLLFLCGFFAYGPQSPFWALCPDLLGRRRAGTGTGVMNTFAYLFAGLGEPFIGHIIDQHGDASLVFPIVAGASLTGSIIALFIRR